MTKWSYDQEQRAGRLQGEEGLTIAQVGRIRECLLQGFTEAEQLVLDLTAVVEVDLAGLQLLCSAHRFAVLHDKSLMVTGGNARIRSLVQAAGFVRSTPCTIGKDAPCCWAGMA